MADHTSSTYHDRHSNTYDRMASKATYNIATHFLPTLTPLITADSYILDNASGTGIVSALIKAQHPHARIKAVDLAPRVLEILEAKMQAAGCDNVETEVLDVRDLKTLKAGTFSHVITNFGIGSDTKDPGGPLRAVKEIYRVLKEGGVAVVTTWAERNFTIPFANTAKRIRPDEVPYSWDIPEDWDRGWWLMKQLDEAGFRNRVEVKSVTKQMEASSVEELVGNLLLFKDMFFSGYSEEEVGRLPGVLAEEVRKLDAFGESEGLARVEMVAWIGMAWK